MANLPISRFLSERLLEYDPSFEVRRGSGFSRLFFEPLQFIVQPIRDEAEIIRIGQSFNLILQQEDPDSFDEEFVDSLASNIFVFRREGGFASGSARVYFQNAVDREYPTGGFVVNSSGDLSFTNSGPFKITAEQMSVQVDGGLFYFDIPVTAAEAGSDWQIEADELVTVINDNDVVRVTNLLPFSGGADREKNTELIERSRSSIGVRDLLVPKGFNAILFENFKDFLLEVQTVGFGDIEMMRDIIYNTHIGGRTDGYVKTTEIKTGEKSVIGLLIDTTRQTRTMTNIIMTGLNQTFVGNQNLDRSNGRAPVVIEIKISTAAEYLSPVILTSPIDLSVKQYIRLGIDGTFKDIRVAGVLPAQTTRTEIINNINNAFGINVVFAAGASILVKSPTNGLSSQVVIDNPSVGISAILEVFGLITGSAPYVYSGDGPVTYLEGVHYEVEDSTGLFKRIEGTQILAVQTTGETVDGANTFEDPTSNIFINVLPKDILRIKTGGDIGDYRVLSVPTNNQLILDADLTDTASAIEYEIFRSGIKSGEVVQVEYYYNPLSIDVGNLVALSETGDPQNPIVLSRGIRPGREDQTITDTAFLRVVKIEEIDALTEEVTGVLLDGEGGYGQGGFGQGGYGVGEGQDYFLVVNRPYDRFSAFEDSYIVLRQGYQGGSFKVTYEYVPEITTLHDFVRRENERVLDGDILIKHFLPAYVSGTIVYRVDTTDSTIPDNNTVSELVKDFINQVPASQNLEYSDVIQFILRTVDPFNRYGAQVKFFSLEATIHNMDGTLTFVGGEDQLEFPTKDPQGQRITNPLSPRICHWIADELILEREL